MGEKPILFSGEMVRAILDGRKTQTRRVVKPQPPGSHIDDTGLSFVFMKNWLADGKRSPYGKPGDTLWVRETWLKLDRSGWCDPSKPEDFYDACYNRVNAIAYRANCNADSERIRQEYGYRWCPSIFMPRWASRISLLVKDVRVERVQNIRHSDAIAEGIERGGASPIHAFSELWNSINGTRPGCAWSDNPWVWVVEFEQVVP